MDKNSELSLEQQNVNSEIFPDQKISAIKESAVAQLADNNKDHAESDNINREEIIEEIKKAKNEDNSRYYIKELFENEKLEGKEIPMEYRQKIVDEIGASGACSYVIVTHPERFEGTTIEKCVLNAVKQGELLDDYCIQLMISWKPFNYIQLLEGMLAIELNNNSQGDEKSNDFKDNMRELLTHYLSYMWKGLRGVEEDAYKNISDKILESDYYIFLPELLENSRFQKTLKPTDELYKNLADKLIENYENLDDQDKKKLEECILKKDPYIFLEKVDKLPGNLLDDERILKLLDGGLSGAGTEKSINIAEIPDKYADRLIETGNWRMIFGEFGEAEHFQGKIDFLDKIKKIFKYEKGQGRSTTRIFDVILDLGGQDFVDRNQLSKICEEEGLDIKKYPRIF